MSNKLRVGIILDDCKQPEFIWDFINKSKLGKYFSIELLVIQKKNVKENSLFNKLFSHLKRKGLKSLIRRISFSLIEVLEKTIFKSNKELTNFYKKYDLKKINIKKLSVYPNISKSGFIYKYSKNDLEKIQDENLDVLVRGGSGILRGDILTLCKYGIISFHHGNNDINRGGPPGFWEVYNKEPSTGFIIQKLKNELDGGDVLFKGEIMTSSIYSINMARLITKANIFLFKILEKIGKNNSLPQIYPVSPYDRLLYRIPSTTVQIRYILKTLTHNLKKILRKIFNKSYRWGVGYQFTDDWQNAVLWKSKIIDNPRGHFLADPFVIFKKNKYICFVENYSFKAKKGHISAYEINKNGYLYLGDALKEDFHLSYPYLFEHNDSLFMCPETSKNNDIRIYKCVEFPLSWKLHKILIKNIDACDTNIFFHQKKWWIMTNVDSSNIGDHNSELHIYYSDSLDSQEWIPHPANPIIFDSNKARNGGLLKKNGDLYRVFQVQDWDFYGKSIGIAKIETLTEKNYSEKIIHEVQPRFFENIDGIHTYNFDEGLLTFDFIKKNNGAK